MSRDSTEAEGTMSREDVRAAIERGAAVVEQARAEGDPRREAKAHAEIAALHTMLGAFDEATAAMRAAVACGQAAWDADGELSREELRALGESPVKRSIPWARHRYGLARLLGRDPATRDEARALYDTVANLMRAYHGYEPSEALRTLYVQCYERSIELAVEEEDFAAASILAAIMAQELESWPEAKPALYAALRYRARFEQIVGTAKSNRFILEKAVAAQTRAVKVALEMRDVAATIRARLELQALHNLMGRHAEPIAFGKLIDLARAAGDEALVGDLLLERAATSIREGRLVIGESEAQEVRQRAMAGRDPTRYLLACMLIAEARERRDDRPGVIEILLTCKATLEAEVGLGVGEQVKQVLDSLVYRWGETAMREALVTYRQRMGAGHA